MRRRTFAIISHPDARKTTLTEKLLLFGGAIPLVGEGPLNAAQWRQRAIEQQTRKLFEVCRLRDVLTITFVNKLDREAAIRSTRWTRSSGRWRST